MYTKWVKALGQQHWVAKGAHTTLCGMPLLGNNYAGRGLEERKCVDCTVLMSSDDSDEESEDMLTTEDKMEILLELKDTQAMLENMLSMTRRVSHVEKEPARLTTLKALIRRLETLWIA